MKSLLVRYLVIAKVLVPILFNLPINLAIGVLVYRQATVPTWSLDGAVVDSLCTCYLLPLLTCLLDTPTVRWSVRRGLLPRLPLTGWKRWFRGALWWRSSKFGVATLLLLGGPVLGAYAGLAGDAIPRTDFLVLKVVFAVLLGMLVTPLTALVAMTDE